MLLGDRVRHRQSQAGALADGLGREERIEDFRLHFLGHAGPVVVDLEDDGVAVGIVPRPQDQGAAAVRVEHGLLGVHDQVEENLLDLVRIGEHRRQARGQRFENRDVGDALFVGAQGERLAHDLIEIDGRPGRVPLARERLQVAHDARGPFGGVVDGVEIAAGELVEPPPAQPLGARQDRRQRVVQLVRDARHRLAQRGEFFGLRQLQIEIARLILQLSPLGDVAHQRFEAERLAGGKALGVGGDLDPHRRSVHAPQAEQVGADLAVAADLVQEIDARLIVDEPIGGEREHDGRRRVGRPAEHDLQVRIGGEGRGLVAADEADVHALLERFEEVRERVVGEPRATGFHDRRPSEESVVRALLRQSASACGRGAPAYFFSMASRMAVSEAPELCIWRAWVATSMQTSQTMPCCSHCEGFAGGVACAHEAVVVAAMAAALAAAEARHVLEHFGVLGREEVRRLHDFGRTCRGVDVARRPAGGPARPRTTTAAAAPAARWTSAFSTRPAWFPRPTSRPP